MEIRIRNIGDKSIGASTDTPLPKPFQRTRLSPGEERSFSCKKEDLQKNYPNRDGFKVVDIIKHLVQQRLIKVDIDEAWDELDVVDSKSTMDDLPLFAGLREQKGNESGVDMSEQDDLPEMLDPLYNVPQKDAPQKKRQASSNDSRAISEDSSEYVSKSGIELPEDVFISPPKQKEKDVNRDKFEGAIKMAFVGAGQGGGRLAESFYQLGYGRVCCVNTTQQDLASLTVPQKLIIGRNRGGAGKDPEQGRLAAKESYEDIMDLMMRSWGEGVEQIWVTIGGGGGSGTGSWPVLVRAAKEYAESTNVEKPVTKHLGVIMTMPKRSEGSRVQLNAFSALKQAVEMVEAKKISTLVILDNAKIHELYPGLPVKKFWKTANHNFAAVLHTFNLLAAKDSEFNCLDAETEALTNRGWVAGFDLHPSDVLLTKNIETGVLEWQEMSDLKLFPEYDGPLVEFETRTFSAVSTPDHRWPVLDHYHKENICKVTNEIRGQHSIHRTGVYEGADKSPWSDDFVELCGWFLTDGTCHIHPEKEIKKQKNRVYAGPRIRVILCQSERANPGKVAQIDGLLERLGCCAHRGEWKKDQRINWRVNRPTSEMLNALFPERTLTADFIASLTRDQARKLLETMMLGDGNLAGTDGRQQIFTARSKEAIDAFQMLCTLCGHASTSRWRDMSKYEPKSDKLTNVPKMTGVWIATILRRDTVKVKEEQKREFNSRQGVWCPVVPNTFFVARRKGSVYVTGNTFDKQDFRSVLRNGIVIFGMTTIHEWGEVEDISMAVRQNLTGSLLADGFDLSKADMAGAIVVAHDDVLEEVPMEHIDYAFNSLSRALGNEGITLHSGIYEGKSPGMRVFTIVSGLEPPKSRFDELERLST